MDKLLPAGYTWLLLEPIKPQMLVEALRLHGLEEIPGEDHDPRILACASAVADAGAGAWIKDFYTNDEIPWCGLFVAYLAAKSGYRVQPDCLSARGWLDWGRPCDYPGLGDVLIFYRGNPSGKSGHVGLYVGEDTEAFHVLGGNQGNQVSITRISKDRLLGVRRHPDAKVGRRVSLSPKGKVSENEA